MNTTLEPLVKDRLNDFTNLSAMKFNDVITMRSAYFYTLDRMHFVYLNAEPASERNYTMSILNRDQQQNFKLMHLNFMQTFNILFGLEFTLVSEEGEIHTKFFNATLDAKSFLFEVSKFIKTLEYAKKPIRISRIQRLNLQLIYYNINMESSIHYEFDFALNQQSG